jgi:hypothetical protein
MARWQWLVTCCGAALSCADPSTCDDRCGEGTQCVAGKCVVAPPNAEVEAAPEPEAESRPRGRRRRKGRRGGDDTAPTTAGPPPSFNDSAVPNYDPNRDQAIGDNAGSERISDRTIRQHLSRFEPRLNACIEQIAAAGVDIPSGQVSFEIGIEPNGRVRGVTASAPKSMKATGMVACMRLAISKYRFPAWDGPALGVEYSFEVG